MKHAYLKPILLCFALIASLFFCINHFRLANAASFTVTTTADSGPGSLRQALIDANIAPGPDLISFAVSGTIVIGSLLPAVQDDVSLQGTGADQLTISGSYLYRLFDVRAGAAMTVSDLALTQGRAPNGEAGGAIRSYGPLTLERVHLHDNLSVSEGGAVYVKDGALNIASSQIVSNIASMNGGVYIDSSVAAIIGTVFAQNKGSAITAYRAPSVLITDTQIFSNTGRGLDAEWSTIHLADVQVLANTGGGINTYLGQLVIEASAIAGNRASSGAGIYVDGTTRLTDTLLTDNRAQSAGGALYQSMFSRGLTITGGAITRNTAPYGAGIYLMGGDLQVRSTHIVDNASSHGAALYLSVMHDAVVTDSCIVNNTTSNGLAVEMSRFNSYYLSAPNTWWGAADGPSGAGPGSGDSIDDRVIYANFKTSAPAGCPTLRTVRVYLPVVNR